METRRRHYVSVEDNAGALLATVRATTGAYEIEAEIGRKAVRFIRKHVTEDPDLLIDILGLTKHDESATTEA